MEARARIALGVAGGYLLGRTKKLKLALALGSAVAGQKVGAGGMLGKGMEVLSSSPEFDRLRKQFGGVGKSAALSAASSSLSRVTQRIEDGGSQSAEQDTDHADRDADSGDGAPPRRRSSSRSSDKSASSRSSGERSSSRSSGKSASSRSSGKSASPRSSRERASTRSTGMRSGDSERARPAKKTAAKKTAAKKSAAKKSTARRASARPARSAATERRGGRRG